MVCTDQLAALADPTRRGIFELIRARPSSVRELTDQVAVSQPAVSQHLRVLHEARLVHRRAVGRRHIHSVDPTGLRVLREWIESLWEDVLDAYVEEADRRHERRS